MSLRAAIAACAIFAFAGVDASRCKPSSSISDSISATETISTSTEAEASSQTASSAASSSTESSTELIPTTTTSAAEQTSSSETETSTTSAAPEETLYFLNGGFDNGGTGWTAGPGAGFIDNSNYHTNPGSALVAVTNTGESSASYISTQLHKLVPQQEYEVSLYWFLDWFVPGGDQCTYGFYIDGVGHTYTPTWISGDRSFHRISDRFTAPQASPVFEFKLWCTYFYDTGEIDWSPLVNAYIDDADITAV
ncbi:hypothetical protein NM208_g7301 [Fusarium decemcellulare]|uniref:Uncharacterized protein n=1 Tax=Fusarium decemcellulare TaxID=57161 RepID=A0ACC1S9Q6_9HYPO|nr:hypothetical protein NM208_g7301 [Fusarium decemcellulare]